MDEQVKIPSIPKVSNMTSSNGNDIPNQFIIETEEGDFFQSYSTIIVFRPREGKIILDEQSWDYSQTTGKYRNLFLREDKKETQRKINEGIYILADLNNRR